MICPHCSGEFIPKKHNQRFCSSQCKWTFGNANRTIKPNVRSECKVCGETFERYVEPSKITAGLAKAVYCGRKCAGMDRRGEKHPLWNGGRTVVNGYIWAYQPQHPYAKATGYVLEHRLVMEQSLGRLLLPEEVVHHINGVTDDNRPENLQLYASNSEHKRDDYRLRAIDDSGRFLTKEPVNG